jgi:DNA-binding NarL/FixJ family response regulator
MSEQHDLHCLIADDHPLFRDAISLVLRSTFPRASLYHAASIDEAIEQLEAFAEMDLILLDLDMPGMNGLEGLNRLRAKTPLAAVAMVSATTDRTTVLSALQAGATGFVSKSSDQQALQSALKAIVAGQLVMPEGLSSHETPDSEFNDGLAQLTQKELEVLERIQIGESNKQIAYHLNIAETTVKTHVSSILQKLNCHNRVQVALKVPPKHTL